MDILKKEPVPRKLCAVIFLLDTSGSMWGSPIGAVNAAIENILPELIDMNNSNADSEIKVAIMTFDTDVQWIFGEQELISPEDLQNSWNQLNAGGVTSMGEAFEVLNEKLSVSHGFMKQASCARAPVLFLLSDGEPTDDYQAGLQKLKENGWYKYAARVAIGYGPECNDDVLREFTGNKETVLHTDDVAELKKLIKFAVVTSSKVASQGSRPLTNADASDAVDPDDNTQKTADALKVQGALVDSDDLDSMNF